VAENVRDQNADVAAATSLARVSSKLIENVNVELEAFIGNVQMSVKELTALKAEAVVALDAQLNQTVELRMNGMAVARGELVAVGDKFGVRLTEISQWPE